MITGVTGRITNKIDTLDWEVDIVLELQGSHEKIGCLDVVEGKEFVAMIHIIS
jgi:hypothetical protein